MKKLVYLAVAVVAMAFTACKSETPNVDDPKSYCWEITVKATVAGQTASDTTYFWGTGEDVQRTIDLAKAQYANIPGASVDVKAAKSNMNETQCEDAIFAE